MVQKQLPTGFRDDIGAVAERKDDVSQYLLSLCRNRQYTKISTPLVEYKDVFNGYTLGRGQHMYEFFGSSDASVVIRPCQSVVSWRLRILNCLASSTILAMC